MAAVAFMRDWKRRRPRRWQRIAHAARALTPAGWFWLVYLAVATVTVLTVITLGYHGAVMRALS